jgi:hypothetical protein
MVDEKRRDGLLFVLLVYAASRLFYLGAGALFASLVPVARFQRITADVPFGTMNLWSHWDGEHYVALAADGYLQPPSNASPAFFPLYPLLIRGFAGLFGGPLSQPALSVWAPLVSLLALPFALYFVYRIAEDGWGEHAARVAVLTLALFPTSFFFNAAYTESLFLALSAGSLWAARVRKDLLIACLLAALATATRTVGVCLMVPLACIWFADREHYGWRGAYLALAPTGLLAYAAFLWYRFGDPFLFYSAQEQWNRQPTGPLGVARTVWDNTSEGLTRLLGPRLHDDPSLGHLADALARAQTAFSLALLVLALVLVVAGFRLLTLDLSVYALLLVAVPVFFGTPENPLMGLPRYVLVAFPIFIALGTLLEGRRRTADLWVAASAAVSLVPCALFVTWRFVA